MKDWRLVIVSQQDPGHMTGGQGVCLLNLGRHAAKITGREVLHLSLRLAGEPAQAFYGGGAIKVERLSASDSDHIATQYHGNEEEQFRRRMEFNAGVLAYIRTHCDPAETLLSLNGFYSEALLAAELPEYRSLSWYHLLLSKRLELTAERDAYYPKIIALEQQSFRASRRIQVNSEGMKEDVLSLMPAAERPQILSRITVIPNGVEDELYDTPAQTAPLPGRIVSWGRIAPEKGFEYLIQAVNEVPEAELLIFGRVDDGERERRVYRDKLEALARDNPRIKLDFRSDGVRGAEKIACIDSAEIVVIPSIYEPFGITIPETLARGKPLITTNTMGACEILKARAIGKGACGWLVPVEDGRISPAALAAAIKAVLKDRKLQAAMAECGRERALDYRWSGIAKRILSELAGSEGGLIGTPRDKSGCSSAGAMAKATEEQEL